MIPITKARSRWRDDVSHCVADALAAGDKDVASDKSRELLAAVERFRKDRVTTTNRCALGRASASPAA
jgi:hypothetical protein